MTVQKKKTQASETQGPGTEQKKKMKYHKSFLEPSRYLFMFDLKNWV